MEIYAFKVRSGHIFRYVIETDLSPLPTEYPARQRHGARMRSAARRSSSLDVSMRIVGSVHVRNNHVFPGAGVIGAERQPQ